MKIELYKILELINPESEQVLFILNFASKNAVTYSNSFASCFMREEKYSLIEQYFLREQDSINFNHTLYLCDYDGGNYEVICKFTEASDHLDKLILLKNKAFPKRIKLMFGAVDADNNLDKSASIWIA